jgi:hypothetical protein
MVRRFGFCFLAACLSVSSPAFAQGQGLVVKMGEAWIFNLENGQPANARRVSPDSKLEQNELMVRLEPQNGTTMIVTNKTDRFLNYRASIVGPTREQPTSVCTLMSGGRFAIENWGGKIPAIRLSDFQPAATDTMVCR